MVNKGKCMIEGFIRDVASDEAGILGLRNMIEDFPALLKTEGNKALHFAIYLDKIPFVKELLDQGVDFKSPGHKGFTPIQNAVQFGSLGSVKLLLNVGADLHQTWNGTGETWSLLDILQFSAANFDRIPAEKATEICQFLCSKGVKFIASKYKIPGVSNNSSVEELVVARNGPIIFSREKPSQSHPGMMEGSIIIKDVDFQANDEGIKPQKSEPSSVKKEPSQQGQHKPYAPALKRGFFNGK